MGKTLNFKKNLPCHVAIIMDGNRRWAAQRGLSHIKGHKEALNRISEIIKYSAEIGIKYLTFWFWSTKNWKRNQVFIDDLMNLIRENLKGESALLQEAIENGAKLHHLGVWDGFPDDIQRKIRGHLHQEPKEKRIDVNLAIGYEGREELIRAIKKMINAKVSADQISLETIGQYLDTASQPDVDFLIRTGGEKRTSGFLIWQIADAEYYFTDVFMPDFTVEEFEKALVDYSKRERRMGGDSKYY